MWNMFTVNKEHQSDINWCLSTTDVFVVNFEEIFDLALAFFLILMALSMWMLAGYLVLSIKITFTQHGDTLF